MQYAIIEREVWGDGAIRAQECPGAIIVDASRVRARVRDLCGRDVLGYASVREELRRRGRIFAGRKWSGGFIVEVVVDRRDLDAEADTDAIYRAEASVGA